MAVAPHRSLIVKFLIWRRHHLSDKVFIVILSIVIGLLSGFAAVIIKKAVHFIQDLLTQDFNVDYQNYLYFVYPAIGIFLTVIVIKYLLKRPVGHGIPNVLYSISKNSGIFPFYQTYASIVTSALTVGFGGSVGLEGPTVSTGAAIGSNVGQLLRLEFKQLVLLIGCASAAAMAAIFKAPIAAIIFAIEVLMLDLTLTAMVPLLTASVTASIISYVFLGQQFIYNFRVEEEYVISQTPYYILLGVLAGFLSLHFTRTYIYIDNKFLTIKNWFTRFAIGATILGILIFLVPSLYGEGYNAISSCLHGDYSYLFNNTFYYELQNNTTFIIIIFITIILLKVIATSCTFGAGGIGGIFAPSLFIGANAGLFFAEFINKTGITKLDPSNFALVGMAGLIAGVIHAPLTAIFLIAEITGGYMLFIPLMIVSTISYTTIRYFEKNSVYTRQLAKRGELFTHDKDKVILGLMKVDDLLETSFLTVKENATLGELVQTITKSKRNVFPVIDNEGEFRGIVHLNDIRHVIFKPELYDTVLVENLMHSPMTTATLDNTVEEIVEKFQNTNHYNIVVLRDDKYIGFLSRANVFSKYRKMLKAFSED